MNRIKKDGFLDIKISIESDNSNNNFTIYHFLFNGDPLGSIKVENFNIIPLGCSIEVCNTLLAIVGVDPSVYTTKEQIEFLKQNNIKMPVKTYAIPFTVKKQGLAHIKAISEYEAILKLERGEFEKLILNGGVQIYKYDKNRDNESYLVE